VNSALGGRGPDLCALDYAGKALDQIGDLAAICQRRAGGRVNAEKPRHRLLSGMRIAVFLAEESACATATNTIRVCVSRIESLGTS